MVANFQSENIDKIIEKLTDIIDKSIQTKSRQGYFAALYRKVTIRIKEGIADNFFDNGERMERFDVIFANRYLTASETYQNHDKPSQSWQYAFQVDKQWWPIVLQHLLLGMNAHINLDLGIAAAKVAPGEELRNLHNDFNKINTILAELVGGVKEELAEIWPILRILNRYLGSVETALINFSMEKARDHAWSVAERLAPLPESEQTDKINEMDAEMALFARVIRYPGLIGSTVTKIIRLGEIGTIRKIIKILE